MTLSNSVILITATPSRATHLTGLTVDRVLVNVDTSESFRLLNDRMAYVAVSRAREEALIYTDSSENLRDSLNRGTDRENGHKRHTAASDGSRKLLMLLVGARGFEPPSSRSQTERTTRLCYAPKADAFYEASERWSSCYGI